MILNLYILDQSFQKRIKDQKDGVYLFFTI